MLKLCRSCKYDRDGLCIEGNNYWRAYKAKVDDECEDYEVRDEAKEDESAAAGNN